MFLLTRLTTTGFHSITRAQRRHMQSKTIKVVLAFHYSSRSAYTTHHPQTFEEQGWVFVHPSNMVMCLGCIRRRDGMGMCEHDPYWIECYREEVVCKEDWGWYNTMEYISIWYVHRRWDYEPWEERYRATDTVSASLEVLETASS